MLAALLPKEITVASLRESRSHRLLLRRLKRRRSRTVASRVSGRSNALSHGVRRVPTLVRGAASCERDEMPSKDGRGRRTRDETAGNARSTGLVPGDGERRLDAASRRRPSSARLRAGLPLPTRRREQETHTPKPSPSPCIAPRARRALSSPPSRAPSTLATLGFTSRRRFETNATPSRATISGPTPPIHPTPPKPLHRRASRAQNRRGDRRTTRKPPGRRNRHDDWRPHSDLTPAPRSPRSPFASTHHH